MVNGKKRKTFVKGLFGILLTVFLMMTLIPAWCFAVGENSSKVAAGAGARSSAETAGAEGTESIDVKGADTASEKALDELEENNGLLLFAEDQTVSKSRAASSETVVLSYTEKLRYEDFFTRDFRVTAGGKTRIAYCVQPKEFPPEEGSVTAVKYDAGLMKKALYYSYGYPGYDTHTKGYLAGRKVESDYVGAEGAYILSHLVLSYLYDNESINSDAFKGVSDATKADVMDMTGKIENEWPEVPDQASLSLSMTTTEAKWDIGNQLQMTPSIKLQGSSANCIQVKVPEGAAMIKTSGAKTSQYSGGTIVPVYGGDSFSFTAPASIQGTYESPQMTGALSEFQPYLISVAEKQDIVYGGDGRRASVAFAIKWVPMGKVELVKSSAEPEITDGNERFSLEGAEYEVTDKAGTVYGTLITDVSGKASAVLPQGQYFLKEIKAPKGYAMDQKQARFQVGTGTVKMEVKENIIRGGLTFIKKDEDGKLLPGISFTVKSKTTGEVITVTTDENGMVRTSSDQLPYDTYIIDEVRSDANVGLQLVKDLEVIIDEAGEIVDLGEVIDKKILIHTLAVNKETGDKNIIAGNKSYISDTIKYEGLEPNKMYVVQGTLMDKATGEKIKVNDRTVTSGTIFTAASADGTAVVDFEFDSSQTAGKQIVVFESIYSEGKLIAEHRDINSVDQTVTISKPSTPPTGDGKWIIFSSALAVLAVIAAAMALKSGMWYNHGEK